MSRSLFPTRIHSPLNSAIISYISSSTVILINCFGNFRKCHKICGFSYNFRTLSPTSFSYSHLWCVVRNLSGAVSLWNALSNCIPLQEIVTATAALNPSPSWLIFSSYLLLFWHIVVFALTTYKYSKVRTVLSACQMSVSVSSCLLVIES